MQIYRRLPENVKSFTYRNIIKVINSKECPLRQAGSCPDEKDCRQCPAGGIQELVESKGGGKIVALAQG